MNAHRRRGFTLIEVIIALGILSILTLGVLSLTTTADKANQGVSDRVEAEHSGQATMSYIVRELQTASAFYYPEALANTIGYRRTVTGSPTDTITYWRFRVGADQRLYHEQFETVTDSGFSGLLKSEVISDGINSLSFTYSVDGTEESTITALPADGTEPRMFFTIKVTFSVTCGLTTVELSSVVSTLNIRGTNIMMGITPIGVQ